MVKDHEMILLEGALTVKPLGYWFTAGGEKGSFGYYPHLKNREGFPVYPDTQLHGDLRMAAEWLLKLRGDQDRSLLNKIFGFGGKKNAGEPVSSRRFLTDLELTKESKGKCKSERFEIKPRIAIEDDTRTVTEHMLVQLEMAYLEGLELDARVYLGYFDSDDEAKHARTLLEEAAMLLSGFGAFRSRGYGRGTVSVKLDKKLRITGEDTTSPCKAGGLYFLEALVPFRNKPIEPGRTQVIESLYEIEADQLRGWFVRTYHDLYGEWPKQEEMCRISFSTLYPCADEKATLAYPAAMTTLKDEEGKIGDRWGQKRNEKGEEEENFFSGKTRPLGKGNYVTDSVKPDVVTLDTERRFRNAMNSDFVTTGDGLFVQELIRPGTVFGGRVVLPELNDDLGRRAWHILKNVRPIIKGAIFKPLLEEAPAWQGETAVSTPRLVVAPIPLAGLNNNGTEKDFDPTDLPAFRRLAGLKNNGTEKDCITVTTLRRYNTTINRPRRNRIVIAPGSILCGDARQGTISWPHFGKKILEPEKPKDVVQVPNDKYLPAAGKFAFAQDLGDRWETAITKAQMGVLREYLHPNMSIEAARSILNHRAEKHEKKQSNSPLAKLYGKLALLAQEEDMTTLSNYVRTLLEELAIRNADAKLKQKGEKKS